MFGKKYLKFYIFNGLKYYILGYGALIYILFSPYRYGRYGLIVNITIVKASGEYGCLSNNRNMLYMFNIYTLYRYYVGISRRQPS